MGRNWKDDDDYHDHDDDDHHHHDDDESDADYDQIDFEIRETNQNFCQSSF